MELKHDLKTRGLKVSGTKGELILRLETDDLRRRSENKKIRKMGDDNSISVDEQRGRGSFRSVSRKTKCMIFVVAGVCFI